LTAENSPTASRVTDQARTPALRAAGRRDVAETHGPPGSAAAVKVAPETSEDAFVALPDEPAQPLLRLPLSTGPSVWIRRIAGMPWPLAVVLGIQATLSVRLVSSNSAFLDEATYIWAGHLEWAHWLHGAPIPAYPTYFSGAPVIYPPLAAMADSFGGLAGARVLSTVFMLGTTTTLWGTASRLFGRRAAVAATVLFVLLGPTEYLGAFATYDAMALFLLTAGAWLLVVARDRDDSSLLLLAGTITLVAANATKYATALFDPTAAALGALAIVDKRGVKAAAGRFGCIAACTVALASGILAIGGSWYLVGVESTTTARHSGTTAASQVLIDAARWVWLPCAIAVAGVALAAFSQRGRATTLLLCVLAGGGALVPLEQARIHTTVSLTKQVDFGAWFAAIAAGYAVAWLSRTSRHAWLRAAIALPILVAAAYPAWLAGPPQALSFMRSWANTTKPVAILRPLVRKYPGPLLAEDYDVFGYYLRKQVRWQDWSNTWYFTYKRKTAQSAPGTGVQPTGLGAFAAAVRARYFSLIVLDFGDTAAADHSVTAAIRRYGDYHVVAELPYSDSHGTGKYTVWARLPVSHGIEQ